MSNRIKPSPPINVFISYAHEDQIFLDKLRTALAPLKQANKIDCFWDGRISPGALIEETISKYIREAHLILLLHSSSYYACDECARQLSESLARQQEDEAMVVPILIRPVAQMNEKLAELQPVPWNRRPVTMWKGRDDAWCDIAHRIGGVVDEILSKGLPRQQPDHMKITFKTFSGIVTEMRESIKNANHLWVVTRTGQGWWRDLPELDRMFGSMEKGDHRLLLLNPECEAFNIVRLQWRPWHFKPERTFTEYKDDALSNLKVMRAKQRAARRNIDIVKTLDAILPLVLLMVNPTSQGGDSSVVYAEFPMLYISGESRADSGGTESRYQEKPIAKITPRQYRFYKHFYRTYEELWQTATS